MRLSILAALFVLCAAMPAAASDDVADCGTLDICITRLRQLAQAPAGQPSYAESTTPQERELVEQVLKFDGAIPALVEMLANPNLDLANIAAAGLRDAEDIDPKFLPQVLAGLDRGLGWLPPALGAMHSDAACKEAVARYLVSKSAPANQVGYAVQRCGSRAIAFIVAAAQCQPACGADDQYLLGEALGQMGHERASAAPGLLHIAANAGTTVETAEGALRMIAHLGEDGRSLEDQLLALGKRRPELSASIDQALVGIGAQKSGEIYAARIAKSPNVVTLRDLAATGGAAQGAGVAVVELLKHEKWEIRLAAARTLGYIGYAPASMALIPLLSDETDVRLNWVAAESLGRLRAVDAADALRKTAASHWHPAVRQAAAKALQHIQDGTEYVGELHPQNFASEFFDYEHMGQGMAPCESPQVARVVEDPSRKLNSETPSKRLEELAYDVENVSYDPPEAPLGQKADGDGRAIDVTSQHLVVRRQSMRQVPAVALRVDGGWIAGSNRGEWGGELMFVADDASATRVLEQNVEDIHRLGDRVVVVAGLAHLSMNNGVLLEVSRSADKSWKAQPWRALPGAPKSSWLVQTGELLVNTNGGGTILVSADGAMRMAPCASEP